MPAVYDPGRPNRYFPKHKYHGIAIGQNLNRFDELLRGTQWPQVEASLLKIAAGGGVKRRTLVLVLVAAAVVLGLGAWQQSPAPAAAPAMLSFRIGHGSKWFDLTPEGKRRLYQRMFEPGYSQSAELRVPRKYGMTFRLKCTDGCWPGEKPPSLFLVDVGLGYDTADRKPGDPEVWDKSFPGNAVSTAPARFRCPDGLRSSLSPH